MRGTMFWALVAAAGLLAGCGKPEPTPPTGGKEKVEQHNHGGWWCTEHGVPEGECSRCGGPEREKAFKDKNDWCDKHDRAKSLCFVCDPGLKAKYAAAYKVKTGKEPPAAAD